VLKVTGHARLHDATWVEQLATHASVVAFAKRSFWPPASADATPISVKKIAAVKANFIQSSPFFDSDISLNILRKPAP